MIDERFAARISSWLRGSDRPARQPNDNVARAMGHIHQTRQRRRWLWFLPGPRPTAGAKAEQDLDQESPPTSSQGKSVPAPIGGTTTMISATKMIGLAASLALVGALALALPANQPEGSVGPAAAPAEPAEMAPFSGTMRTLSIDDYGETVAHDWGRALMDQQWTFEHDFDDERLNGMGRSRVNDHRIAGSSGGPKSFTLYIENDGGSWVGTGRAYNGVNGGGWHHQTVLTGQGGYEGLTAILAADQSAQSSVLEVSGVMFTGGLPPLPEAAPTEFE